MRIATGAALSLSWVLLGTGALACASPTAPSPTGSAPSSAPSSTPSSTTAADTKLPRLKVRTVVRGLENPWDVQAAPGGRLLVTERDRARLSVVRKGRRTTLADLSSSVRVAGETGLMSMAVDPGSRTVWICHGATTKEGADVRVSRLKINRSWTRLVKRRTVLAGLPATSGRHGGCRLLIDRRDGALLVGTGDAAVGTNPRDLDSLGGKVLRLDGRTGEPMTDNPWAEATSPRRYVFTYGHRNVQGLAQRQDGSVWSIEHGSDRDDEINLLTPGGDYGWNPVPGYNESVPMTDQGLPGDQVDARWSSGTPTLATSGAAWVKGRQWGRLDGTMAVAALKASQVLFVKFDKDGVLKSTWSPAPLRKFGRLRSVTALSGGALLITTSNGDDDRVLKVSPRR